MSKLEKEFPDDLVDITAIPRSTILRDMNVYMGVPADHPLAGHDYDSLPVDCHGGLTFADAGDGKYMPKGYYWYGYDYSHFGDYAWYEGGTPDFMENDKKWSLGEIVKDAWEPIYEFKKFVKLAENIKSRS
jgi:hypothetical protein